MVRTVRIAKSSGNNLKSKTFPRLTRSIQTPKCVGFLAIVVLLGGWVIMADAQQPAKVFRIGYLSSTWSERQKSRLVAFQQGLRDLGYVEGKNIIIEYRNADGYERLPDLWPNWSVLTLTSSLRQAHLRPMLPRTRPRRFPSLCKVAIRWGLGLSPAWRGQVGISRGCRTSL